MAGAPVVDYLNVGLRDNANADMNVDPDVALTGQPYAYGADDPVNQNDPSGDNTTGDILCTGLSLLDPIAGLECAADGGAGGGSSGLTPHPYPPEWGPRAADPFMEISMSSRGAR